MSYMIGWVEDLNFLNHLLVVLNSTDRLINKGLRPQIVREKISKYDFMVFHWQIMHSLFISKHIEYFWMQPL